MAPIRRGTKTALLFKGDLARFRPWFFPLLGEIAYEWSDAEKGLACTYGMIVTGQTADLGTHTELIGDIAAASFEAISAFSQKKEALAIAAAQRFDKQICDELARLVSDLWSVGQRRNKMIHGRWAISKDYPKAMIWSERWAYPDTHKQVYYTHDFEQLVSDISEASRALATLFCEKMVPLLDATVKQYGADDAAASQELRLSQE